MPIGHFKDFSALVRHLRGKKGVTDPKALAATMERRHAMKEGLKKHGKKRGAM